VDNEQFQFGQVLKPAVGNIFTEFLDSAKKWYVTQYQGFDINKMVATTLLFEGELNDVDNQEKKVYEIAAKHGGLKGGEENGKRGYFLTYMIAYIRDFGFKFGFIAESFETSVPWSNLLDLCKNVKQRVIQCCKENGVTNSPFVSCRVTQGYDTGAAVYFYFGFIFFGVKEPLKVYMAIETEARNEIIRCGGSISHHHGVGKLRKQWVEQTISPGGVQILQGIKQTVDPQNIFGNKNLI